MMILNLSKSLAKPLVMAKLNMASLAKPLVMAKLNMASLAKPLVMAKLNMASLAKPLVMAKLNMASLAKPLVMAKLNMASLAKPLVMAKLNMVVKFKQTSKTAVVLLAGVTISGTPCPRHFTVPFGAEAPSGHVAQAWAIPPPSWGLLSRWHRQETTTPETNEASYERTNERSVQFCPNPATFLRDFTLYMTTKIHYFKKKVSKLYCIFNRNSAGVPIWEHGKNPFREKNRRR